MELRYSYSSMEPSLITRVSSPFCHWQNNYATREKKINETPSSKSLMVCLDFGYRKEKKRKEEKMRLTV